MNATKKFGIWMDYSVANVIEFSELPHEIKSIHSNFKSKLKSKEKEKGENYLHALERECKTKYFKEIASMLINYDKVLLFGPTKAKTELFNILSEDSHFFKIQIYLKEAGKMTLNQRKKLIHDYFVSPVCR